MRNINWLVHNQVLLVLFFLLDFFVKLCFPSFQDDSTCIGLVSLFSLSLLILEVLERALIRTAEFNKATGALCHVGSIKMIWIVKSRVFLWVLTDLMVFHSYYCLTLTVRSVMVLCLPLLEKTLYLVVVWCIILDLGLWVFQL